MMTGKIQIQMQNSINKFLIAEAGQLAETFSAVLILKRPLKIKNS